MDNEYDVFYCTRMQKERSEENAKVDFIIDNEKVELMHENAIINQNASNLIENSSSKYQQNTYVMNYSSPSNAKSYFLFLFNAPLYQNLLYQQHSEKNEHSVYNVYNAS